LVEVVGSPLKKRAAHRQARANPRNLKGFLDAFKAVLTPQAASRRPDAPSLTHCEDFA
jgi:hypothetical protein